MSSSPSVSLVNRFSGFSLDPAIDRLHSGIIGWRSGTGHGANHVVHRQKLVVLLRGIHRTLIRMKDHLMFRETLLKRKEIFQAADVGHPVAALGGQRMADDLVVPQIHVQRQFVIDAFDVKCRHIANDTLERPVHVHLREQQIGVDPALLARLPVAIMPRLALDSGRLAALVRIWI